MDKYNRCNCKNGMCCTISIPDLMEENVYVDNNIKQIIKKSNKYNNKSITHQRKLQKLKDVQKYFFLPKIYPLLQVVKFF